MNAVKTRMASTILLLPLTLALSACGGEPPSPELDRQLESLSARVTSGGEVNSQRSEAPTVSGLNTGVEADGNAKESPVAGASSPEAGAASKLAARATEARQGPIAPDFTLATGADTKFSLSEHKGEVVVLYFSFPG